MHELKVYIIPIVFILFIIYRRVKRTIGFQKYSRNKLIFRVILFFVLAIFTLSRTLQIPSSLAINIIGIVLGLALLYFAIKNTKFENRSDGIYYRTHIWIELTILCLFFGRLIYRLFITNKTINKFQHREEFNLAQPNFKDPGTNAIFLILCAYYVGYFIFVMWRTHKDKMLKTEIYHSKDDSTTQV